MADLADANIADTLPGLANLGELTTLLRGQSRQKRAGHDAPLISGEPWAIRSDEFDAMQARADQLGMLMELRLSREAAARMDSLTVRRDDVAVIDVMGTLVKRDSVYSYYFNATSYQRIGHALRSAIADPDIKAIVLRIDSPGGMVDGIAELADQIHAARAVKPVLAHVDGLCCSAAYYLGSQASAIYAGRMDVIGSIGVRMLLYDWSKLFEAEGIKPVNIDTGEHKSTGAMGLPITDAQKAELQRIVDQAFAEFKSAVLRGRANFDNKSLSELADGRVWRGGDAKKLGLIDGVKSLDEVVGMARKAKPAKAATKASDETPEPEAASDTAVSDEVTSEQAEAAVAAVDTAMDALEAHLEATAPTSSPVQEPTPMPDASIPTSPQPAAYADIVKTCRGIEPSKAEDSMFVTEQLAKGHTLEQVSASWQDTLQARAQAAREEIDQLKAAAAKPAEKTAVTKPGVKPVAAAPTANEEAGDPEANWNAAVSAMQAKMPTASRDAVVRRVVAENPELRQAMIASVNERAGRAYSHN